MNKVLLIDGAYVKASSTFDINISDKLLVKSIVKIQNEFIKDALGTTLYNDLLNQVSASTLTSANTTLLQEYVQVALSSFVQWDVLEHLYYKPSAKSIEHQTSNNAQVISEKGFDRYKSKLLDDAQGDLNRLILYLQANRELYPSYVTQTNPDVDTVYPNTDSPYTGGIYTQSGNDRAKYVILPNGNRLPLDN